jgi:hypothetical protein
MSSSNSRCWPLRTDWDFRVLTMLWRAAARYLRIGFGLLDVDPYEHERREQVHADLIAAFRKRDPDVASQAIYDDLARNEQTARTALDAYRDGAERASLSDDKSAADVLCSLMICNACGSWSAIASTRSACS